MEHRIRELGQSPIPHSYTPSRMARLLGVEIGDHQRPYPFGVPGIILPATAQGARLVERIPKCWPSHPAFSKRRHQVTLPVVDRADPHRAARRPLCSGRVPYPVQSLWEPSRPQRLHVAPRCAGSWRTGRMLAPSTSTDGNWPLIHSFHEKNPAHHPPQSLIQLAAAATPFPPRAPGRSSRVRSGSSRSAVYRVPECRPSRRPACSGTSPAPRPAAGRILLRGDRPSSRSGTRGFLYGGDVVPGGR